MLIGDSTNDFITSDCKFVSKIDERSREVARTELHELNDKDRELAVQTLRQWVLEQSTWLTSPTDFEFLLRFLRSRKFSQLEARHSLEHHWTCKTLRPQWFKDVDPAEEGILAFLKSGFMCSPKKCDKYGRRVLIVRAANLDGSIVKKYGNDNVFRSMLCVKEWLVTDENTQVNGVVSFFDQSKSDFMLMTSLWTPSVAKDYMQYFQKAEPMRQKQIAIYNESCFIDLLMGITKPFMSEKILNRFKIYGNSMVKLYEEWGKESFPKEYLPDDYPGPHLGNLDDIVDEMVKDMLKPRFRDYIKELSNGTYKVDTQVRKHDTQSELASFRKLNVE